MKTIGQLIKTARIAKGLSIDQVSSLTKIDSKYIEAIENNQIYDLPSETFAKGFIRNISMRLDLNPNEMVAIFRRDYRAPAASEKPKTHKKTIISSPSLSQHLPVVIGVAVFIVYLIFQFRATLTPPKLEVIKPEDRAIVTSPLEIEGTTSNDATIFIGDDTLIKPDSSGHFSAKINYPVGEITIEVKATNRFSRSSTVNIPVTVISK